jgi:GNAT superfamily N-acetyltransferase
MQLREATEDDLDTLVDFWYALATEMEPYSDLNEVVYDGPDEVPTDGFRRQLDSDDVTNYLVVDDGPVGFVTLRDGEHPSRQWPRYVDVVDLFVTSEHRNRGHGSEVLERVREMARERGCDHLKVSCEWANEDARRFYTDHGFEEKQVQFVQRLE